MPTQKTFKHRVRTRMIKTGESYTAARHQLLKKAAEPDAAAPAPDESTAALAPANGPTEAPAPGDFGVSDEAMLARTGRRHAAWFALLDDWGATDHDHTEIARWLGEVQGVPPWWTQSITVSYERARGMRGRHEMRDGFSISASRTVAAGPERALAAFTGEAARRRWLPDAALTPRPTRARLTARFDWPEPASRVVVSIVPRGADRSTVTVTHERIRDAAAAEGLKRAWKGWLGELKAVLEGD